MFVFKSKQNRNRIKREYYQNIQLYLRENSFRIVQKLYASIDNKFEVDYKYIQDILESNYPRVPWIKDNDYLQQFISILKVAGYMNKVSCDKIEEKDVYDWCDTIIKNHLKLYGKQILESISCFCKTNNGKITYLQMLKALGFTASTCDCKDISNVRECILLYLRETKIPFKYDSTYIYLP